MKNLYKTIKQKVREYALPVLIVGSLNLMGCGIKQPDQSEYLIDGNKISVYDNDFRNCSFMEYQRDGDSIKYDKNVIKGFDLLEINGKEIKDKKVLKRGEKRFDTLLSRIYSIDDSLKEVESNKLIEMLNVESSNKKSY